MVDDLKPAFEAGQAHTDPLEYIEVLRDRRAINERFAELQAQVKREILVFTKPPYATPPQENVEGLEVIADARGARRSTSSRVFDDPDVAARRASASSRRARRPASCPSLPLKLVIIDETIVMFGMEDPVAGSADLTIVVVEHQSLAQGPQDRLRRDLGHRPDLRAGLRQARHAERPDRLTPGARLRLAFAYADHVRELLPTIDQWRSEGVGFGRAVVVRTFGSAPRQVGSVLLASDDGRIAGSVSGGCVEGAVVEEIEKARRTGRSAVVRYGISDEQAWSVGLACGSTIEVLVEPELRAEVEVGARASDDRVIPIALPDGSGEFEEVFPAPRRLVVYGAVEIARPLVRLAHELGYRVVVVDARSAFATAERFPEADELIVGWPDEVGERVCLATSDSVAVLAHDPKLDDPALLMAFAAGCRYVGALGSKKTQAERRERLAAAGVSAVDIGRLHGPIGLDLGGREPAETALAIMAEVVADRYGGSGSPKSA